MSGPVEVYAGALRRYIAARVPGPDADDVLQEALIRVHLGVGNLRSQERVAPWVYRVARHAVVDHWRQAGRNAAGSLDSEPEAQAEMRDDEDDDKDEVRALLSACVEPFLEGLPAEQAEALRLVELQGVRQVEAAKILDVPLPTLKSRVQRGRVGMRRAFEACCALAKDGRGTVVSAECRCD